MRQELGSLLRSAGVHFERSDWTRLIMLRSSGSLIHPFRETDRNLSDRGFHFLVTSADGRLSHYCKCRPLRSDGISHRETQVLQAFSEDTRARQLIPAFTSARSKQIELQVTGYVEGERLNLYWREMSREQRSPIIAEVCDAAAVLCQAALQRPQTFSGPFNDGLFVDRAAAALRSLHQLNVPADVQSVLRNALSEAGAVPAVPQHGDYWPENIMRRETGGWCVLDLDNFGDVDVPLYDVLHFMRTTEDASRPGLRGSWIDLAFSETPAGEATRRVIANERDRWQLRTKTVAGCALFYLLHIGFHIYSRGAPEIVWGRFRDELPAAVRRLQATGSLENFGAALLH